MKRKVLCIFSLLLILLVYCTFISLKVEEEMSTLVEAKKTFTGRSGRNVTISNLAATWKNSETALYNVVEGEGWESGLRIAEIPSSYYDRYEGHIALGPGTDYWYIYSASRELVPGDSVIPATDIYQGDDTYLLWSPTTIEKMDKLPNSMEVLQHNGNTAVLSIRRAYFPFFEHRIWYSLKDDFGEDIRIYSLYDVHRFVNALPWIGGVLAVLLCSLILWSASWILIGRNGMIRGGLCLNILLIAGILALLPFLLNQFDLPASLMPAECILDILHYINTFDRIVTAMNSMGDFLVAEALHQKIMMLGGIMGSSLLLTIACVVFEILLLKNLAVNRKQCEQTLFSMK